MAASFSKSRALVWSVWTMASIFYAYQYVLRVMPNIMLPDIMRQFHIDAAAFGQFSGVYYLGYSLMHLPIGMMLDRFGPRRVMSGCILLTVLGLLPLMFANHWAYPVLGRVLIGVGSSGAILGVFKIVRMMFSEKLFPRLLSFSVTIGLMGAIYGGGPVNYLRDSFGFHAVVWLFAAAGMALAFATYWIIPASRAQEASSVLSNLKEVLGNRKVLWTCVFAGLMVGPLEGFADVWGTAFLKQAYGFENALAASLPSTIFIGMCFGAPLLTFIADKCGNYLAAIFGAGFVMAAGFFGLLAGLPNPTAIAALFAVIGVCCAYQILAIYKASTYVREEVAGLTTALANMIIMAFGYGFHSAIGATVDWLGGVHSAKALSCGVAVIPAALCIGTLGFLGLLLREKRPARLELKNSLR